MDPITAMYVTQGMHGLAYGMVLFLVASGLTLIFGMMGILNMAHAAFFMLSAYFAYQITLWTGNFWLALLLGAPLATGICGNACREVSPQKDSRPGTCGGIDCDDRGHVCDSGAVKFILGNRVVTCNASSNYSTGPRNIAGMVYPVYRLFVIGSDQPLSWFLWL